MTFVIVALLLGAPESVPLLLDAPAPKGFEQRRFEDALATYVTEAALAVEHVSDAIADNDLCEQARSLLGSRHSDAVLLARWQGSDLRVAMLLPGAACPKLQSVGIEVRAPFFYRVVALKIASLLREAPRREQPSAPPDEPPSEPASAPAQLSLVYVEPKTTPTSQPMTPARDWLVGAGASVRVSDIPVVPELGLHYGSRVWRFGGRLVVGVPIERTRPSGMGYVELAGAYASLRRSVIADTRFGLTSQLDVGAILVWANGKQTGGGESHRRYVVPEVAASLLGSFAFNEHIGVEVGPALDFALRRIVISMSGDSLFDSSRATLRAVGRLTIRF